MDCFPNGLSQWACLVFVVCMSVASGASTRQRNTEDTSLQLMAPSNSHHGSNCIKGGPIKHLNFNAGAWINIFVDMPFTCSGEIYGYEFYSRVHGHLYMGVWRPLDGGTRARLIAKDVIPIDFTGAVTAIVPEQSRLPFQQGDWFGVHYGDTASDVNGGVVPYEDSRNTLCCGLTPDDLGRFHNSWHRDSSLPVGVEIDITLVDNVYRVPAIQPLTQTSGGPGPGPGPTTSPTIGPGPVVPPIPPSSADCGVPAIVPELDDRIVGGVPAKQHSWPWMVSLRSGSSSSSWHFCGGTLISDRFVLTASHCTPVWSSASYTERQVVLGAHYMSTATAAQVTVNVDYVIDHPSGDISLLKLSESVTPRAEISPACVPQAGYTLPGGFHCYTTGWGTTQSGGSSSDVLLQVSVPLVDRDQCNQADWYGGSIGDDMICAGYEWGGSDSCQGDSGGPLVCKVGSSWQLMGVVSWGHGCAASKKPGVYTEVSDYTSWIATNMAAYGN